jgi:nucleoid-associated protein YgaU
MTRETKIGLLVGLAFIIVIGILLSDHLTSTTEPQGAPLARVGNDARSATVTPAAPVAPPITTIPPTQNVAPQQPVPTKEEVTPKQPPVEIVHVGGAPAQPTTPQPPITPVEPPSQNTQVAQGDRNPPPALSNAQNVSRPLDARPGSLADVASRMGEELVPAGPQAHVAPPASPTLPNGMKAYKAEAGDNLAKIALKTMGKSSKANIDAIVAANPTLQQNPNLVVAGRSYNIPATAKAAPTPAPTPAPVEPAITENAAPQPAVASKPEYFYTVQPGDSLTRIAVMQLGTAGAVAAIKDLNQDVLKGGDVIRPNMKLRLPAKPIASAS